VIEDPSCAVCASRNLRKIGARRYARSDVEQLSDYEKARYQVLFEVWFPGKEAVTLTSKSCEDCGFVTYTPRPTTEDVDRKYHFLADLGLSGPTADPDSEIERRRARELHSHASRYAPKGRCLRVLDFGGGDGRLMRGFLAEGAECHLVDFNGTTLPGVRRIGTTERDLDETCRYDLIVCSHVVEHVAEPVSVVSTLAAYLKPDGVIYVEVPMEVWSKAPLHNEPVTHVNFFTPVSCRHLVARAKLQTLSCRLGAHLHSTGASKLVVRTVGRLGPVATWLPSGARETAALLSPGPLLRLKRYALQPDKIAGAVSAKLGLPLSFRKRN
jgi:2-polyprenyl-3-methyl-5-hydroxy-6-metoxy-1,4-benzoquinol methylase